MKLTCKSLSGEFTIDVSENTAEEVTRVLGVRFNVHPQRVSLVPWEGIDYAVVIQSPHWKLLDWIPLQRLSWQQLSANPRAIQLLQQYPERIDWHMLSINPEAIPMLIEQRENIVWHQFAGNPSPDAIPLLEEYLQQGGGEESSFNDKPEHYLFWIRLSGNPNALPLLEKYMNHVKWYDLMHTNPSSDLIPFLQRHMDEREIVDQSSHNPYAIELIRKHNDCINWSELSKNPNAIDLLENNIDRINWLALSKNPNAIPILEWHLDKVAWYYLCENPNAMPLIMQHMDNIRWSFLCNNRNPLAMQLIEQNLHNLDRIDNLECARDGLSLSRNPSALPLLSRHPEFINWNVLATHPEIFKWIE